MVNRGPYCPTRGRGGTGTVPVKRETTTGQISPVIEGLPGSQGKKNVIKARVNGLEMDVLIDTGADFGLVPKCVVPENSFDGGECYISGVNEGLVLCRLTRAKFELAGIQLEKEVIVDERENGSPWCILPLDLGNKGEVQAYTKALREGNVNVYD